MRFSKAEIIDRVHKVPELRFEDQRLTSYAGIVVLQELFSKLALKNQLKESFKHRQEEGVYGYHRIVLILIIHFFLGFRRLRDMDYYREDPMVLRAVGLKRLPDVSTVSRVMSKTDAEGVFNIGEKNREMVLRRLKKLGLRRVTMDFDGSVLSSEKMAEGTAVGFNKRKKGQRSYYPLFARLLKQDKYWLC